MDDSAEPRRVQFQREMTVGGRAYCLDLSTTDDDRAALRLVSRGVDGETLSELTGIFAPDDLTTIGRLLRPEFDRLAAWCGVPQARRVQVPKHGAPWTVGEERRLKELQHSGLPVKEIAQILERSDGSIRSRLARLSIDP